MSFLDKIIAAVTPPESDETRLKARAQARSKAVVGGWLEAVLEQHDAIEAAFDAARGSSEAAERTRAAERLIILLTAHANAEETVLYPEIADTGHKAHASLAYEEQAMTKVQLALLEKLDPASQEWLDKLEHIRGAVTHHMYQEESDWFPELQSEVPSSCQMRLGERFRQEVQRYVDAAG